MDKPKNSDLANISAETEDKSSLISPAAQTPDVNGRKRPLITTPPSTALTDKNNPGKNTNTSPTLLQDAKKRVLYDDNGEQVAKGAHTTPETTVNLNQNSNENNDDNNNNAEPDPIIPNRRGRRGGRGGRGSRTTRSVSRRRVPQPRAHSSDTISPDIIKPATEGNTSDILLAISNMKNEITNSKNEIFDKIDDKIDNLKVEFRSTVSEIKDNIENINIDITGLTENQINIQNKVESCEIKIEENTQLISSIKAQNKTDLDNVHSQVTQIENDLATDIETLKLNIEEKLVDRNDTLDQLKSQLATLKSEYDSDREQNRAEFKKLFDDYNAIQKQIGEAFGKEGREELNRQRGTFIKQPFETQIGDYQQARLEHPKQNVERFKNLVVDGLYESPVEDLRHIVVHMCHDMNVPISPEEIEEAKRIGPPDPTRRWPRPVRVIFSSEATRVRIYEDRNNVKQTTLFNNARINADEPKEVRVRRAKIRQAGELATQAGKAVRCTLSGIEIDGKAYTVNEIPPEYQIKQRGSTIIKTPETDTEIHIEVNGEVKYSDNRKPFRVAHRRLKDGQTKIEMVGPCLQKTKRGLAFISGKCFLSNFFKCNVRYNGFDYKSSEQCWQAQKALICKDPIAMAEIKTAKEPLDAKRIGDRIVENDHWKRIRIEKMFDILQHKFRQHRNLYYMLINTRPFDLIEASLDGFWGAHCKLYSIALQEGTWKGQNILGRILVDVRMDLCREEEAKRLHSPPPPPPPLRTTHSSPLGQRPPTTPHETTPMQVDIQTPATGTLQQQHNTRL